MTYVPTAVLLHVHLTMHSFGSVGRSVGHSFSHSVIQSFIHLDKQWQLSGRSWVRGPINTRTCRLMRRKASPKYIKIHKASKFQWLCTDVFSTVLPVKAREKVRARAWLDGHMMFLFKMSLYGSLRSCWITIACLNPLPSQGCTVGDTESGIHVHLHYSQSDDLHTGE